MKLKHYFLIIGSLLTFITLFLPLTESCDSFDEENGMTYFYSAGMYSINFYSGLFFCIILLLISLLTRGKAAIIFAICISVLGLLFMLFILSISTAGWGRPCGTSPTFYHLLMSLGHAFIIIFCFIHLYKKKSIKNESQLLDDF